MDGKTIAVMGEVVMVAAFLLYCNSVYIRWLMYVRKCKERKKKTLRACKGAVTDL